LDCQLSGSDWWKITIKDYGIGFDEKYAERIMNDPAASRRGIPEEFSFKSRGKPRGINPTGGIQTLRTLTRQK
jgi:hypothetical protein